MKKFLILLLLPSFALAQQKTIYKNLVLEGGSVRGIAYVGVLKALEEKNILQQIEKVAGSSAGAIAGLIISIGYNSAEIDSMIRKLAIQQFNDGKGGVFGKYTRLKRDYGIYKGRKFEKWLLKLVKHKTGKEQLTFAELHELHLKDGRYKDLYCTGTNLTKQRLEVFSYEHSPSMPVALAVRISGSIPFYFEPIALNDDKIKISDKDTLSTRNYYVDGGLLCNYPISMFDTCENNENPLLCDKVRFNTQTLGIKLERAQQIGNFQNNNISIPGYTIDKFSEYINAFGNLVIETLNRKYPNLENEMGRTIYVSFGNVEPKIKRMDPAEQKLLLENGFNAACNFLVGY